MDTIEAVCLQIESAIGRRPPGFDQGILRAAAASRQARPQQETANTAGLPPLPPEAEDGVELHAY